MSWNVQTAIIEHKEAAVALAELEIPPYAYSDPASMAQIDAARHVALELTKSVPGPHIRITMSGHASGAGWREDNNDSITVNVSHARAPEPTRGMPDE